MLLTRGFSSRGDRFGISELCQRCQRSDKTVRRAITQGRSLGWVKSWSDSAFGTVYSRHAPGPYVAVLDPLGVDPKRVAHKVAMLMQFSDCMVSAGVVSELTGMKKSCVYSAISELKAYGFISKRGNGLSLSYAARMELKSLDILKQSMSGSNVPKPKTSGANKRNSQLYDDWVAAGCPSLDDYDVGDAAVILLYRFIFLLDLLENVRCAPDGTKIADVKTILHWLTCPEDFGFSSSECQRLLRITAGTPHQTALMAVDSLFTKAFSGFTYDFNVLFRFTEDKNNFDRFVIGSYLKSLKRPEWRSELLNRISGESNSESVESYEDFKSRLLGN